MNERIIKTNLKGKKYQEIIDSMLGQVSDGIWENSPKSEHYWPFISVEMAGKEVVLVVSEELWQRRISNAFVDMDDNKVKEWCANKIKAVIKEEGLGWKRNNEEETEYCSRHEGTTVSDCYYVYEVLKGRNVLKHTEYGIREATEILKQNGYILTEKHFDDDVTEELSAIYNDAMKRLVELAKKTDPENTDRTLLNFRREIAEWMA